MTQIFQSESQYQSIINKVPLTLPQRKFSFPLTPISMKNQSSKLKDEVNHGLCSGALMELAR